MSRKKQFEVYVWSGENYKIYKIEAEGYDHAASILRSDEKAYPIPRGAVVIIEKERGTGRFFMKLHSQLYSISARAAILEMSMRGRS